MTAVDFDAVEAILFDLDGTLIDTDDTLIARWERRLDRLAWLFPNRDPRPFLRRALMHAETPGNTFVSALDVLYLDRLLHGLSERLYRARGLATPSTVAPIAGADQLLTALATRYPLALVTTRIRRQAEALLAASGLPPVFKVIVGALDVRRMKPHPEPILRAAELLAVPPERCVMVGDTRVDMKAARAAGAWAVGVLCGFGERDELERAGAHLILETTPMLVEHLPPPKRPRVNL
jgi:HAD superfamily hydrolase (TIGR01509 family)